MRLPSEDDITSYVWLEGELAQLEAYAPAGRRVPR